MSSQTNNAPKNRRISKLAGNAHVLAGLTAVYGPLLLVFLLPLGIWGKAYVAVALWASEGIVWTWLEGRAERRRRGHGYPLGTAGR